MEISKRWAHLLIFVLIISLSGLIFGTQATYNNRPPIPDRVIDPSGKTLFTKQDILNGQAVFQKYGLMDYGSVFGHGAYLGPDFTADALHRMGLSMRDYLAEKNYGKAYSQLDAAQKASVDSQVIADAKTNRLNEATLTFTASQAHAYQQLKTYYGELFSKGSPDARIPERMIPKNEAEQLASFFAWTAWAAAANRPGLDYSYTNNWPSDEIVGNRPPVHAMIWSSASVGALLALLGLMLYAYKRYNLRMEAHDFKPEELLNVNSMVPTPSQLKTAKYFLIVAVLFLAQTLVGALAAHYFVDSSFYGIDLLDIFPFNIIRGWHLQLAVFWVATAWLGTGLFVAPLVGGREPKGQGLLVDVLFVAVVIVAIGSLIGQWLGVKGYLGKLWFLLGHQGWEYLELGRLWQILLLVGMGIWLFIVYRALRYRLATEKGPGSLSHLLLYSAITIPGFYAFGLLYNPATNFTVADFWRWFVVHLWVEGMFEFFTVVVIAYLFVALGLVSIKSATRAVYFTVILVFGTGLLGVGHHYYWTGAPAMWLAIGAVFSAMEVVPLTLLIFEAWDQSKILERAGTGFAYRVPFMFLIATAIWNFVGAGLLGFIANLPIVNYYEHGTYLTPAHGHAAMMGVYGMLALGLMLFSLRSIVRPEFWPGKAMSLSFWLLNIGLVMMLVMNLLPVGFLQLAASFQQGTWYARSLDFVGSPAVRILTWLRMPGDLVFIAGVVVLLAGVARSVFHLKRVESRVTAQRLAAESSFKAAR